MKKREIIDGGIDMKFYDAAGGKYRCGVCPRCKEEARTMVLDVDTGIFTCMACGFLGTTKKQTDIQKYLPADSKIHELNAAVGKIFTETLYTKYGNTALEYLKKRGITDEIIQRFGLGYASNGKHARVELEKMGFSEEELIASGIFKRNEDGSLWFRFSGRVMFEIHDVKGRVIGFSGRVMDGGEPKYKNSPESEFFRKRNNLYGFDQAIYSEKKYIILCEGQMDIIAMHQAGFTNAVATLGTALTEVQVRMIRNFTKCVVLLYDGDQAGEKATKKAIELFQNTGVEVFIANTAPCKDPDEFLKTYGKDAVRKKIKAAITDLEYMVQLAVNEDGAPDYNEISNILLKNYEPEKLKKLVEKKRNGQ